MPVSIDAEKAFSAVESADSVETAVAEIRDCLVVDHLVYHSSKLGSSPSVDPYVRLTYPAAWIKRYLQMGYVDVDPVLREGFQRTLPFDWQELTISTAEEMALLHDALAHGVGPNGLSVPVRSKRGHRGLVSLTSSSHRPDWEAYRLANLTVLVEVANRLHRRVIREEFGEEGPRLAAREVECLRWIASGKEAGDIGIILNISPHTVRDYLKSARYKLNCVTSAQAVSKAVKLGILSL